MAAFRTGEIQFLIDRGLFYLRYTTSDPAEFMRKKGLRVVADYVAHYADEWDTGAARHRVTVNNQAAPDLCQIDRPPSG